MSKYEISEHQFNNVYTDIQSQDPKQHAINEVERKRREQEEHELNIENGETKITGNHPQIIKHHNVPIDLDEMHDDDLEDLRYFVTFVGEIDRWIDLNEHDLRMHMKP